MWKRSNSYIEKQNNDDSKKQKVDRHAKWFKNMKPR